MSAFDLNLGERMSAHLEAQRSLLAESWNQCFDVRCQLLPGDRTTVNLAELPELWRQPGLVVLFEQGNTGAAVLVPASCGLPEWYRTPNDSQKSRLDTLAMEWSLNLWPEDHAVERSGSLVVPNLAEYLAASQPATDAVWQTLDVQDESEERLGTLALVWPLAERLWECPTAAAAPSAEESAAPTTGPVAPAMTRAPDPFARLRKLPVTISVRLAEKRISLSQLMALTPGALVTFSKPCDDLLDLYVNNSLYCRGEAVKIGESFGLKIDHVGVQVERKSKLLY